jgi:hypothetical protein
VDAELQACGGPVPAAWQTEDRNLLGMLVQALRVRTAAERDQGEGMSDIFEKICRIQAIEQCSGSFQVSIGHKFLRDFFAAAALCGMMARVMNKDGDAYIPFVEERARVAYENADAMLKAREAKVKQ